MSTTYSTADEAKAAIRTALGDYADDFDVDVIFAATHQWQADIDEAGVQHGNGWFEQTVSADEFWQIVEQSEPLS